MIRAHFRPRAGRGRRAIPGGLNVAVARDEAAFATELRDADVVVLEKRTLTADLLRNAERLKFVQVFGRDTNAVDVAACAARGISVATLDRNTNLVVAEHTILMILAMAHNLDAARQAMSLPSRLPPSGWAYNWPACPNVRGISGRTIGLIGMGEVAQLVALYLRPFGVRVVYTRRHRDVALETELGISFMDLPMLLAISDVVSVHVPGGSDNRHLIDAGALERMKPGALLVNTARGTVVDEAALLAALRSGHIGGAALDVFSVEPLPLGHPLHGAPNVILTPHLAAGSRDAAWLDIEIGPVIDAILGVHASIVPGRAA